MASRSKHVFFHRPPFLPSWKSTKGWLGHYFGGLYDRLDRHHAFLNAGGLAFSLFVCVVPMVLLLFAILGMILQKEQVESELAIWIDRVIPYEKYTEEPKRFIFSRVDEFKAYRRVAGIIGSLGLLFAASGLFSSMRTILNNIYHTTISRHILVGKLRDFGMILVVIGFFLLSVLILPSLKIFMDQAGRIAALEFLDIGWFEQIVVFVLSVLVMYIAFWMLYYFIPYAKMEKRVIAVSAFWAALLWEVAKQAFSLYITKAPTLPAIYGTYLFFIVMAFWIYYSSIVFIVGAEIGQLYRERRDKPESVQI